MTQERLDEITRWANENVPGSAAAIVNELIAGVSSLLAENATLRVERDAAFSQLQRIADKVNGGSCDGWHPGVYPWNPIAGIEADISAQPPARDAEQDREQRAKDAKTIREQSRRLKNLTLYRDWKDFAVELDAIAARLAPAETEKR